MTLFVALFFYFFYENAMLQDGAMHRVGFENAPKYAFGARLECAGLVALNQVKMHFCIFVLGAGWQFAKISSISWDVFRIWIA